MDPCVKERLSSRAPARTREGCRREDNRKDPGVDSHFRNKFRKLDLVDYSGSNGLTVNSGFLRVVLHD